MIKSLPPLLFPQTTIQSIQTQEKDQIQCNRSHLDGTNVPICQFVKQHPTLLPYRLLLHQGKPLLSSCS